MLGQSSPTGGCGTAVSAPGPDFDSDRDETLDATIIDSDGDGFSDDDEVNFTPGTDPDDPTDNPTNVRDSDADGCSDFDELNFENFCDNDPNTLSATCETTFYNADYNYGFDLPSTARLVTSNVHANSAFDAQWQVDYALGGIWFQTGVQEVAVDLQAYGENWASEKQANGADILYAGLVALVNGDPGYSVTYTTSWELPGSVFQTDVFVSKHQRLYMAMTYVASVDYTDAAGALIDQAALSVCVD